MVSSEAVRGWTSSTSSITGAGLKKWTPQTLSGRPVCMASSMTGRVEVLVARMVWSAVIRSSSLKSSFFTARSSTTDSMTRSTSFRAARSDVPVTRARASSRSSSVFLPFSTWRLRDFSRAARVASAVDWLRERRTTSKPLVAAVSAMPEPMIPDPTIPTRAIDIGGNGSGRPPRGARGGPDARTPRHRRSPVSDSDSPVGPLIGRPTGSTVGGPLALRSTLPQRWWPMDDTAGGGAPARPARRRLRGQAHQEPSASPNLRASARATKAARARRGLAVGPAGPGRSLRRRPLTVAPALPA